MVNPPSLLPLIDVSDFREKLSTHLRPWQRSFQFWVRTTDIYTGYKVFQDRVAFEKDPKKQEDMWDRQHELAAEKIYSMCSDLGGFFLKVAQIVGKPDLASVAWVNRLVTICDQAPSTPYGIVKLEVEKELGGNLDQVFETFDMYPLGSQSIAQVHRATLRGHANAVVVKIVFEFDFTRETGAMKKIWKFLHENNKKSPVKVPQVMQKLVTRSVLVMEYIDGVPILKLGDEIAKRGIKPYSKIAAKAKQNILKSLTLAYMILKNGFFHAYPHLGNILICKGSEVYGGEARISTLRTLFPEMEDKKSLFSADELSKLDGKASISAAVDYYVSMHNDIFISASNGNMHNALLGHRAYKILKSIRPNMVLLGNLFLNTSLTWPDFQRSVVAGHKNRHGQVLHLRMVINMFTDGQLCPTVPNRSNYIHWIEDLVALEIIVKKNEEGDVVRGIDIGTGANCIYPLLGATLLGWSFVGLGTQFCVTVSV